MQSIKLLLAILLAAAMAAALWWWADRPVPVAEEWVKPLASVSFAPYRGEQSPLTKNYPTSAQIEDDLKTLVGRADGIRTYTAREGLEIVPELAAKLGLKVTFGAWLGGEAATNEAELTALITAANAHPDSIQRVIVGNEVLLRRDLPADQLIAAIRRVKAAIKQPVSYADVWAFYLKYPEVGREVDYITIHILPFWEDQPVPIDQVESYITGIVERMRQAFPGKPILIGEAGWPSLGRDRGPAVVDTVNEARFVRGMANIAARHDFDYNIVEAFDQNWKSALENTVGAAWGVLDDARRPKFAMQGPVTEILDWRLRAAWAVGLGLVAALWGGRRLNGFAAALTLALMAQMLAWLLITTWFHDFAVSFRPWQYYWLLLRVGLPALLAGAMLMRCRDWLLEPSLALQGTPPAIFGAEQPTFLWRGQIWLALSAGYAIVWTALLFLDGRYRDIPEIDFALPVGGLLAMLAVRLALVLRQGGKVRTALAINGLFPGRLTVAVPLLAWSLPLAAFIALASEGRALIGEDFAKDHPTLVDQIPYILHGFVWNREMDLWAVMLLVWAIPFILSRRSI